MHTYKEEVVHLGFQAQEADENQRLAEKRPLPVFRALDLQTVVRIPGEMGYCGTWASNLGLAAKLLCEPLIGIELEPLIWTTESNYTQDSQRPIDVPALILPDFKKSSKLYVHE